MFMRDRFNAPIVYDRDRGGYCLGTAGYGGQYALPDRTYPAYTYRDFSVGCDWDGAQCRAAAWELTEPMAAYQGPFVLLASFFMGD